MAFDNRVTRRHFLKVSGGAATAIGLLRSPWAFSDPEGSDLTELSVVQAAAAIRDGDIKSEDYAAALLARCEAGKNLNVFISLDADRVLDAARAADQKRASGSKLGVLHGVPLAVKDNMHVTGYTTTAGTNSLRNFHPKTTAPVVATLLRQGAICLGKANMHELALGFTSMNQAFGIVRNPYDPARMPGGSSGGTGAAVAARMAPAGLGSDTNGSIRIPSSLCGGLKFPHTKKLFSVVGQTGQRARHEKQSSQNLLHRVPPIDERATCRHAACNEDRIEIMVFGHPPDASLHINY